MEQITSQSGVINLSNTEIRKDGKPLVTKEETAKKSDFAVFASANIDCSVRPKVVVMDNLDSYDSASDLVKVKTLSNLTNETIVGVVETTINAGSTGYALAKGTVTDNNLTGGAVNQSVYVDTSGILTLNPTDKKIGVLVTVSTPVKVLINLGGEGSSSSGTGTENFIPDYIANNAQINNYIGYNDSSIDPLDGIGGTSDITFTINNTLPLRESGDFKFSKPSGSKLGHGIAYEFSYPEYAKNQEAVVEFNYKTSANYESGDVGIYIYDVTNSALYIPSAVLLTKSSSTAKFRAKFIGGSGDTYRILFHVRSSNSASYDVQIDEITVKRDSTPVGAAISDWTRYTGVFGAALGSVSNVNLFYSRNGESLKLFGSFQVGTPLAQPTTFIPLPPGLSINVDKVVSRVTKLGDAFRISTSFVTTDNVAYHLNYDSSLGSSVLRISAKTNATQYTQDNAFDIIGTNNFINIEAELPIAGWSSNINLIQSATEFAYNTNTSTNLDNTTDFGYGPEGTNFVSIVSSAGVLKKRARFRSPIQISDKIEVEVWNGNGWQSLPHADLAGSSGKLIDLFQGDMLNGSDSYTGVGYKIVNSTDVDVVFGRNAVGRNYSSITYYSDITSFKWRVRKSSGSAVGEIPPFVGARYTGHTSASLTPFITTIKYNNKNYDTHSAYNPATGVYTVPVSGYYSGGGEISQTTANSTPRIFRNGVIYSDGSSSIAGFVAIYPFHGYFDAGDTIDIRYDTAVTTATAATSNFYIAKIG